MSEQLDKFLSEIAHLPPQHRDRVFREELTRQFLAQAESGNTEQAPQAPKPWFQEALAEVGQRINARVDEVSSADDALPVGRQNRSPHPLNAVRCGADVDLIARIREEHHLDHLMEFARPRIGALARQKLKQALWKGIRLTQASAPRLFRILNECRGRLSLLDLELDVICINENTMNASIGCYATGRQWSFVLLISSALIQNLSDAELAFVIGHELGHVIVQDGNSVEQLLTLLSDGNQDGEVLPKRTQSLFKRWSKKLEMSIDRIGLLACGDFDAALGAIARISTGLDRTNFTPDLSSLLADLDRLLDQTRSDPDTFAASRRSHPLLAMRLKALELFSRSEKAREHGYSGGSAVHLLNDETLESSIVKLLERTRRHPVSFSMRALMDLVTFGACAVLRADGEIHLFESSRLMEVLFENFSDAPDRVMDDVVAVLRDWKSSAPGAVTPPGAFPEWLKEPVATAKNECSPEHIRFALSLLAQIAASDGRIFKSESSIIVDIGARLGLGSREVYDIVIQRIQKEGLGDAGALASSLSVQHALKGIGA